MENPELSNYPRSGDDVPDIDRLTSLIRGYFLLDWCYAGMVLVGLIFSILPAGSSLLGLAAAFAILFFSLVVPTRKLAYGLNWDTQRFWLFLVSATLVSFFCGGFFGPILLRYQAKEILDKYKFPGSWGIRRKQPCYFHVERLKARQV